MFAAEFIFTRVVGFRSIVVEDEDLTSELLALSEPKVVKTCITKLLYGSTSPLSTPIFTIDGLLYLVFITSTTDVPSLLDSSMPILSIIEFKLVPFKFIKVEFALLTELFGDGMSRFNWLNTPLRLLPNGTFNRNFPFFPSTWWLRVAMRAALTTKNSVFTPDIFSLLSQQFDCSVRQHPPPFNFKVHGTDGRCQHTNITPMVSHGHCAIFEPIPRHQRVTNDFPLPGYQPSSDWLPPGHMMRRYLQTTAVPADT